MAKRDRKKRSPMAVLTGSPTPDVGVKGYIDASNVLIALISACKSQQLTETHLSDPEIDAVSEVARKAEITFEGALDFLQARVPETTLLIPEDLPEAEQSEQDSPQIEKKSHAEILAEHNRKISDITNLLKVSKRDLYDSGKFPDVQIVALAETLSRVPEETLNAEKNQFVSWTPEKIYAWALANCSIVYPYLTLSQASKHIKAARETQARMTSWGLRDGKFHLAGSAIEEDSNQWTILKEVCRRLVGKENVLEDEELDQTVPPLSNEELVKLPAAGTVVLRILELMKSPGTATIRSGSKLTPEEMIKNQVDFVVLEQRYLKDKDYSNLTPSGTALSHGRRTEKVEKTTGTSKKKTVTYEPIFTGYKLAETLGKYVSSKTKSIPENEPFARFIIDILKLIEKRIDDDFVIPFSFFTSPAAQLRSGVRKGPVIKTKKGERTNLYIPFSFVKSQECAQMPETLKREIVDIGAKVLKNLDQINKLPVKDANSHYPSFERYLRVSYSLSDECRKKWRTSCLVPDVNSLKELVPDDKKLSDLSDYYISNLEKLDLNFSPVTENPTELALVKESVEKEIKRKRDARVKSSR